MKPGIDWTICNKLKCEHYDGIVHCAVSDCHCYNNNHCKIPKKCPNRVIQLVSSTTKNDCMYCYKDEEIG